MRIVFLDIDGVCNSFASALAFGTYSTFDDVAVHLLQRAAAQLDLWFVLSSAWRTGHDVEECQHIFRKRGYTVLAERLIDKTPSLLDSIRGTEIERWLTDRASQMPGEGMVYAIVDDDGDMLEHQKSRFIHTDSYQGFRIIEYVRLLELFEPQHREASQIRRAYGSGLGRTPHQQVSIEW